MRKTILTLLALPLLAATAFAQQESVEIKAQKVAGSIYMLTGGGGNIGVSVGDDGIVLVDDQFAPLVPKIKAALRGITEKPVRFVINTHYHPDHTGGNEVFGGEVPIIAHDNTRKRMQSGTKAGEFVIAASPARALPVVTFDQRLSVHLNGEEIRAIHFPAGHTDGDIVIFFTRSNVVHMGDDFFNGAFPIIDIDNGGSVNGLIANIESVLKTVPDDVRIIPGHGPLSDKAGLRAFADMLKATSALVAEAVKAGKTVDQMKADRLLAKWESWGKGYVKEDMYLQILAGDLSRRGK